MVSGKNVADQFKKNFEKRTIDFSLYKEMCVLFEIYVILKYSLKDEELLQLSSVGLIKDIARVFYEQVNTESLLWVHPLAIKSHLLYYLVNDLHMDDSYIRLLKDVYNKGFIQDNEWVASEWQDIENLYTACCTQEEGYVIKHELTGINNVIEQIKNQKLFSSRLQRLWSELFLEELHEQRCVS